MDRDPSIASMSCLCTDFRLSQVEHALRTVLYLRSASEGGRSYQTSGGRLRNAAAAEQEVQAEQSALHCCCRHIQDVAGDNVSQW